MDDVTKECLTITTAFGISGVQVARILDSIALFRGYLVYAQHWSDDSTCQIIELVTLDAHERIDGLLSGLAKKAEDDFHSIADCDLNSLTFY